MRCKNMSEVALQRSAEDKFRILEKRKITLAARTPLEIKRHKKRCSDAKLQMSVEETKCWKNRLSVSVKKYWKRKRLLNNMLSRSNFLSVAAAQQGDSREYWTSEMVQ